MDPFSRWLKTWKGRFTLLFTIMIYGAFDTRYYLWVRKIFTNKQGTITDE
jgi:hypothetical protein